MEQSLTILFPPWDAIGHVNACIGVAEALQARGHRIVFVISEQWKGKLSVYGFEEELISDPERDPNNDPTKHWTEFASKMGLLMAIPPIEKLKAMFHGFQSIIEKVKSAIPVMKEIVDRIAPHVIVIDSAIMIPSLINCGIPWVSIFSPCPLIFFGDKRLPPPGLGLSVNSDKKEWLELDGIINESMKNMVNNYNELLVENGLNILPEGEFIYKSPYLNFYGYPEEIDYTDIIGTTPSNIYRLEILFDRRKIQCLKYRTN